MANTDTTTCPDTIDGRHMWDTYTIPGRTHLGDTETSTTPDITVRECYACDRRSTG